MRSGCPILAIALALILVDSVSGTLLDDSFRKQEIHLLYFRARRTARKSKRKVYELQDAPVQIIYMPPHRHSRF